jgi:hypothetical protein
MEICSLQMRHRPQLTVVTVVVLLLVPALCQASALIKVVSGPSFSDGSTTIDLKVTQGDETWSVPIRKEGTVKPIEPLVGPNQSYSLNDTKSIFVVNIRPATKVNEIVAVFANNGHDRLVIDDIEQKAAKYLATAGVNVDPRRIFAEKALPDGLLLIYKPDTEETKPFRFRLHVEGEHLWIEKGEITPVE